jgi:hypothetical protein
MQSKVRSHRFNGEGDCYTKQTEANYVHLTQYTWIVNAKLSVFVSRHNFVDIYEGTEMNLQGCLTSLGEGSAVLRGKMSWQKLPKGWMCCTNALGSVEMKNIPCPGGGGNWIPLPRPSIPYPAHYTYWAIAAEFYVIIDLIVKCSSARD